MNKQIERIGVMVVSLIALASTSSRAAEPSSKPSTQPSGGKVKVAVGNFLNKTNLPDEEVRSFTDMITTTLVKTRKFEVLERARIDEVIQEQGMGEMGLMEPKTAQKLGGLLGCDVILIGTLTEAGIKEKGIGTGAFAISKARAYLTVDIRILDAEKGSIKIAETVRVEKEGSSGLKTSQISFGKNDTGIFNQAARDAAQEVVNLTAQTIFPIKILAVGANEVVLIYGSGAIMEGDTFEVFSLGEVMTDPDTGECLGQQETKIGQIKIKSVEAKFSKAEILDGKGKMEKGMICRKIKPNPEEKQEKRKSSVDKVPW